MKQAGKQGSIVSLLCDSGERYSNTYYDDTWYQTQGIPVAQPDALIARAVAGEAVLTRQSIAGMEAAGAGI